MTRRLLATYLTITVFVLLVLEVPFALTYASRERNRFLAALERDARVLGAEVEEPLEQGSPTAIPEVAARYAATIGGRVVVVDGTGTAVADTAPDGGVGTSFANRPEFVRALDGMTASGIRRSETLGADLIYVAVPVASGGVVHGAVRITYPASELDRRTTENLLRLGALAAVVLVGVAAVGLVLARSVTGPVAVLRAATARLAAGDLRARARIERGPPEVRALGVDFDHMAGRLETLVGAQQAFVADASHQLRTPLTALRLRLESLEWAVDDRGRADLDAALDETARLARLVDGLLALARTGTTAPKPIVVDAVAVAHDRRDTWGLLADERSVRMTVEAPEAPVRVRCTDGTLEQVLDNLLENALDAVADAGTVRIAVTPPSGGTVVLAVDDDGPGMPEAERARATDRFWRSPSASPGGSGLGLAIVEQLVRSSGGELALDRSELGGLRVAVRLPSA